jgi:hypothetical protein
MTKNCTFYLHFSFPVFYLMKMYGEEVQSTRKVERGGGSAERLKYAAVQYSVH